MGSKVFLLFPYPEDKCFETHGRTSRTQLPCRKAFHLELEWKVGKGKARFPKGQCHKVRAVHFPSAEPMTWRLNDCHSFQEPACDQHAVGATKKR